jgi:mono/diheme cytochrome c family protein
LCCQTFAMNQIKYILSACLILLMIFMAIFLYTTFPESGIIASNKTVAVDNSSSIKVSSKGELLFKQNCAACHALDKDLIGPALRGVGERGPWAKDKGNLKKWVKDPLQFTSTDPYAKNLKAKFGGYQMPAQNQLSDPEIDEVIQYITR